MVFVLGMPTDLLSYYHNAKISQHMDTMFNPDEGTQLSTSVDGHGNYGDASNRAYPTIFDDNIIVPEHQSDVRTDDSKTSNYKGGNSDNRGLTRQPRPKLRQLKASDVDAICADSEGAINSLRDVQVWCHKCGANGHNCVPSTRAELSSSKLCATTYLVDSRGDECSCATPTCIFL